MQRAFASFSALGAPVCLSPLYRSAAWPDPTDSPYVNAVALIRSALAPMVLLAGLQAIEAGFGRVRSDDPARRYAPRTIDLDLLSVGQEVVRTAQLTLPHPGIADRDFVLRPLLDIAPQWVDPVTGTAGAALLEGLPDRTAHRLPFTGPPGEG